MVDGDGYGVCSGVSPDPNEAVEKLVNDVLFRMKQGWMPQGGVTHVIAPTSPKATHIYTQAIVRRSEAEKVFAADVKAGRISW